MDPFAMSLLSIIVAVGFVFIFALVAKRIEKKKKSKPTELGHTEKPHTPVGHREA